MAPNTRAGAGIRMAKWRRGVRTSARDPGHASRHRRSRGRVASHLSERPSALGRERRLPSDVRDREPWLPTLGLEREFAWRSGGAAYGPQLATRDTRVDTGVAAEELRVI